MSNSGSHVPEFAIFTGWEILDSQIICIFTLTSFLCIPSGFFFFFFGNKFIYLFIFGCVGTSSLGAGFL